MTKSEHIKGAGVCRFLFCLFFSLSLPAAPTILFAETSIDKPRRIVSINLCTDQYLLALADPGQILALSPFAHDANMSFQSGRAGQHDIIKDDAESVIQLRPDLVFASVFNKAETIKLIRRQGIKVVLVGYAQTLGGIADQFQTIADEIDQSDRGAALKGAFLQLMKDSRAIFAQSPMSALYYHRGGYASGPASLTGLLLRHTGLKNQVERYGIASYGSLSMERIIMDPPDLFILSDTTHSKEDQGHRILQHPALRRTIKGKPVLMFPISETVCPGPSTAAALRRLIKFQKELK